MDRAESGFFAKFARTCEPAEQGIAGWLTLLPTAAVAAPEQRQPLDEDLKELHQQVQEARHKYQSEATTETRIRLATWLLLFAEALSRDELRGLWSTSVSAFVEGGELLARVEADVDRDPELESRISATPALAMRLDAARVRRDRAAVAKDLSRDQELARLSQLRDLVQSYREMVPQLERLYLAALLSEPAVARTTSKQLVGAVKHIYEVAGRRRDLFLFTDEPTDDALDFGRVATPVIPVTGESLSFLKALHGLVSYQIALSPDGQAHGDLVRESISSAEAALGEKAADADLPAGNDPNNLLAHYVLGMAYEAQGTGKTRAHSAEKAAHESASGDFAAAKTHLAAAQQLIEKAHGPAELGNMAADIGGRLTSLEAPAADIEEAARLTLQGRADLALKKLRSVAQLHRTSEVWAALIETARRSGAEPAYVLSLCDEATAAQIFPAADHRAQLVLAKARVESAWRDFTVGETDRRSADRLITALRAEQARLAKALKSQASGGDRERSDQGRLELEAYYGLAVAYRLLIAPDGSIKPSDLAEQREAYRLVRDASAGLEAELKRGTDPVRTLAVREALVAARTANGHLAARVLPKTSDEPALAFSAAIDEASRMPPQQQLLKTLGSPLLATLTRNAGSNANQAIEERQLRQIMERFVEGALTLQLGEPAAGADAMGEALKLATGRAAGTDVLDAARLLAQADGFDVHLVFPEAVRAFKSIGELAAGRTNVALRTALETAGVPSIDFSTAEQAVGQLERLQVETAMNRLQSPLASYALGAALEEYADSFGGTGSVEQDVLFDWARRAQQRTAALLESSRSQVRYPHFVQLNRAALARLKSPAPFLQIALERRSQGDLPQAVAALQSAVRRHRRSQEVWKAFMEARIQQPEQGAEGAQRFRSLLEELTIAEQQRMLPASVVNLYRGIIYERLQKRELALAAFDRAKDGAALPEERVRAASGAAALRARIALRGSGQ